MTADRSRLGYAGGESGPALGAADERQTWTRWSEENGVVEDEFWRTPTWRAKCQISGSDSPLRFEHWGARGDFASYLPALLRLTRI